MIRAICLMVFCALVGSCKDKPGEKNEKIIVISNGTAKKVTIDTFTELPPEIDGCAGYYAASQQEFAGKKYLYADDMGDTAFVKIDGVMTKFTLSKPDAIRKSQEIQVWKNKDYELNIILKTTQKINEVQKQEGVLILKPKDGGTVVKKIYGERGC